MKPTGLMGRRSPWRGHSPWRRRPLEIRAADEIAAARGIAASHVAATNGVGSPRPMGSPQFFGRLGAAARSTVRVGPSWGRSSVDAMRIQGRSGVRLEPRGGSESPTCQHGNTPLGRSSARTETLWARPQLLPLLGLPAPGLGIGIPLLLLGLLGSRGRRGRFRRGRRRCLRGLGSGPKSRQGRGAARGFTKDIRISYTDSSAGRRVSPWTGIADYVPRMVRSARGLHTRSSERRPTPSQKLWPKRRRERGRTEEGSP